MLMKNSIIDTTEFNGNSVILFIGTKISALLFIMARDKDK